MSRVLHNGYPAPLAPGHGRVVRGIRLASVLGAWVMRRRTRTRLSELDAHMLADIGVTTAQAHKEAKRPFWDA